MLDIGKFDAFEREYTQRFRERVSGYGEFIAYERDRGARDIGLHLTVKTAEGSERVTTALCWFQLKGRTTDSFSRAEYDTRPSVPVTLDVKHLRYWLLQPMPTYLVVYVEAADEFLILNIQKWVEQEFGKGILSLAQETVTVNVPKNSKLDDRAFELILRANDIEAWRKVLEEDEQSVRLCHRDYSLIWHFGTGEHRSVHHEVEYVDWESKTRGEIHFFEVDDGSDEERELRQHWQFMLTADGVEGMYPYLRFEAPESDEDSWDDELEQRVMVLSNGDQVYGGGILDEVVRYRMKVSLNELGVRLFESVQYLKETGLIEIDESLGEWVSFDPWSARDV